MCIFLNLLVPKLPAPVDDDLSRGILEAIDMDTYRSEKQATVRIDLEDEDAFIDPIQVDRAGGVQEPLLEFLSVIVDEFNKTYGASFTDPEYIAEAIKEMPGKVNEDATYSNAKLNAGRQNAQIENDAAVRRLVLGMLQSHTELYKVYTDNEDFRKWLNRQVFDSTFLIKEDTGQVK